MLKQARQLRHRRVTSRTRERIDIVLRITIVEQRIPVVAVDEVTPPVALSCQLVEMLKVDASAGSAF
jgi:hypothetical protein